MKKILHRGLSARYPENTMLAFRKAFSLGADMIEFDVHLTKDNELVVIHDDDVDRTSNGNGFIKDLNLSELRLLNFNNGNSLAGLIQISTLKEVLDFSKDKMSVNIEVKNLPMKYKDIELKIVDILSNYKEYSDSIVVSSFDFECLKKIHKLDQIINIGILIDDDWSEIYDIISELKPYSVHPNVKFMNDEILLECKKNSIKIFPWVAETVEDMNFLMKKDYVDGIMVNEINLFN